MKDRIVSMTKGVAIILMVLAHTDFSIIGGQFIYMFHMPLFFFMSGYCFKEKYLGDIKTFTIKRIKGAYWPFVKWNLFFLLLHNFFISLHIYGEEYGDIIYNSHDFLKHFLYLTGSMTLSEKLLGGYWFLHSYFFSSFILFAVVWLFRNKKPYILIGGVALLLLSIIMTYFGLKIPGYIYPTEILASFFMVLGYSYKQCKFQIESKPYIVIPISIIIVALGTRYWPGIMGQIPYLIIIPYCLSAFAGCVMVMSICNILSSIKNNQFIVRRLSYIGDHTMGILTWHFSIFKIVNLLLVGLYCLPITLLAESPTIISLSSKGWWVLYTVLGVALPIVIEYYIEQRRKKDENNKFFYT